MKQRWIVDIGVPLKPSYDKAMDVVAQFKEDYSSESSGCGFGFRDVQLAATSRGNATQIVKGVKAVLKENGYKITASHKTKTKAYVCYYKDKS